MIIQVGIIISEGRDQFLQWHITLPGIKDQAKHLVNLMEIRFYDIIEVALQTIAVKHPGRKAFLVAGGCRGECKHLLSVTDQVKVQRIEVPIPYRKLLQCFGELRS